MNDTWLSCPHRDGAFRGGRRAQKKKKTRNGQRRRRRLSHSFDSGARADGRLKKKTLFFSRRPQRHVPARLSGRGRDRHRPPGWYGGGDLEDGVWAGRHSGRRAKKTQLRSLSHLPLPTHPIIGRTLRRLMDIRNQGALEAVRQVSNLGELGAGRRTHTSSTQSSPPPLSLSTSLSPLSSSNSAPPAGARPGTRPPTFGPPWAGPAPLPTGWTH